MKRRRPPPPNPASLLTGHRPQKTLPAPPAPMGAVEYIRLDSLAEMPGNPRGSHRITKLRASLRAHGLASALTVNRATGHVIAGNGRLSALRAMHRAGEPAPDGITTDAAHPNVWFVPVIHGNWDRATEQRVALALNGGPGHSLEGEWDETTIAQILEGSSESDLEALGVEMRQAEQLLADYSEPMIPPVINLDNLERAPGDNAEFVTLRLNISETLARTARRLIASGLTGDQLLTLGTLHHERDQHPDLSSAPSDPSKKQGNGTPDPPVRNKRRSRAQKASAPPARRKSGARATPL